MMIVVWASVYIFSLRVRRPQAARNVRLRYRTSRQPVSRRSAPDEADALHLEDLRGDPSASTKRQ